MDEDIEKDVDSRVSEKFRMGARLEKLVNNIHAYARENAGSLDSERHCAYIRLAIEQAVKIEQKRLAAEQQKVGK